MEVLLWVLLRVLLFMCCSWETRFSQYVNLFAGFVRSFRKQKKRFAYYRYDGTMRRHQYQWRLSVCMQRQLMLSWKSANSSCRVIVCTSRSRHFEGGNTLLCPKILNIPCLHCTLNYTYILGGFIEIFSHISIEIVLHLISIFLLPLKTYWIWWLLWSSCRCTWLASEAKPKQMQTRVRSRDG